MYNPLQFCMCISLVRSLWFRGFRLFVSVMYVFVTVFFSVELFQFLSCRAPFLADLAICVCLIIDGRKVAYKCSIPFFLTFNLVDGYVIAKHTNIFFYIVIFQVHSVQIKHVFRLHLRNNYIFSN